jgi:alkylation response protein AidB-like acyl-CoA dehydrogenase
MFFALTDDQGQFAAAVRGYLAERFDLAAVRGVVEDGDGDGNPATLWKAAGEQGWLAVTVPEEFDGLGLGLVEAQTIARALGAGVAPGPWRGTVLAAEAIRLAGSAEQKAAWLPRLATGTAIGALASGNTLSAVEYGAIADVVVTPEGRLVTGASSTPRGSYDGTVRLADLTGGTVEELVAPVEADIRARAAVLVASELVGIAREALTRTVAYDRERKQFGVPVGSFQAVKHHLADALIALEHARPAVYCAAWSISTAQPTLARDASFAKAYANEAAGVAARVALQCHGAIGYTFEHDLHLWLKRVWSLQRAWGVTAQHRAVVAEAVAGP